MDFDVVALVMMPLVRGVWLLIGYLSGNAFPQPLSEKEEAAALRALRLGDRAAREMLIERNLRLVAHIVKKFENTGEDTDDLISIGTVGLIKGIDTFNPDRGTRLATYAARCIENDDPMTIGRRKKLEYPATQRARSLERPCRYRSLPAARGQASY